MEPLAETELDEGLEGPTDLEPPTSLEPPAETELDAVFLDTVEVKLFKVIKLWPPLTIIGVLTIGDDLVA